MHGYSQIFNTAEINSTFYSYPSQGLAFGWAKYTPPEFKFAVKLNRIITHEKSLDISKFLEKHFILHDCPDWKRTIRERRFLQACRCACSGTSGRQGKEAS